MFKRTPLLFVNSIKVLHDTTLEGIQRELGDDRMDIGTYETPLFGFDTIAIGNFFNKTTRNILIISHPKHLNDYFKIGLVVFEERSSATLNIYLLGASYYFSLEECINYLSNRYNRKRDGLVLPLPASLYTAIREVHWTPLPRNKRDEIEWYMVMFCIIEDVLRHKYISK